MVATGWEISGQERSGFYSDLWSYKNANFAFSLPPTFAIGLKENCVRRYARMRIAQTVILTVCIDVMLCLCVVLEHAGKTRVRINEIRNFFGL